MGWAEASSAEGWIGRSGRRYLPDDQAELRSADRPGGMAIIHRVRAVGAPVGWSSVPEGAILALKRSAPDALALETMAREATTFELLQDCRPAPPCPRLYDVIEEQGAPVGLVMEWCPVDMEGWWDQVLVLPDALEPLCGALADICRRVGEYHDFMAAHGIRSVHADIKPRNAVLAEDGRWLLIDFGAAKSRPLEQEAWEATRLILGTENFIAPEMLFNARKRFPEAMDTWSVGVTFFTLLRMRRHRLEGRPLPPDGTHNELFRCQRMHSVMDLRDRQPALFAGRDLDPAQFASPDRLPEEDRRAVSEALRGVFRRPDPAREARLEAVILALLDQALAIEPGRRFTRARDLSQALDGVVRMYWDLEGATDAAEPLVEETLMAGFDEVPVDGDDAPETAGEAQPHPLEERTVTTGDVPFLDEEPPPGEVAPSPHPDAGPAEVGDEAEEVPVAQLPEVPEPATPPPVTAAPPAAMAALEKELRSLRREVRSLGGLPLWVPLAVGLLLFCQALQFGLLIALFLRSLQAPAPVTLAGVPAAAPAVAVDEVAPPTPAEPAVPAASPTPDSATTPDLPLVEPEPTPEPTTTATVDEPKTAPIRGAGTPERVREPRTAAAPAAAPEEVPATSVVQLATVLVEGGQGYLVGDTGRSHTGSVVPGTYEVFARTGDEGDFTSLGRLTVQAGQSVTFRCGFGACRRVQ